jgi:hypothetical protein
MGARIPASVVRWGAGIVVILGLHLRLHQRWVDVGREYNLPAVFNAALFALAGWAALRNACRVGVAGAPWEWRVVGSAMVFAAIDEVVGIHEGITRVARWWTGVPTLKNIWMIPYVLALGSGFWILRPWWRRLRAQAPASADTVVFGLGCWVASFVFELGVQVYAVPVGLHDLFSCVEEALEMLGALMWYWAFLEARRTTDASGGRQP